MLVATVVRRMLRLSTGDSPIIEGHLVLGGGFLCLLLANTETLPVLTLEWCRAARVGLQFLMQHQQEGRALAFVRSGFKPDAPGGVDCWAVEICPPIQLPVPLSYLSR